MVEDDVVLHTLVAAMLESEAIELVFEADGRSALERIRDVAPDLVLMDIVLPGGDGVALTEQIKATPELAAIPVVMLTGEARLDTLVRSMEAGAADFIVKPFTREALLAKLGRYLPRCLRRRGAEVASRRTQADVTGMPRNWPATAGPLGRG